MGPGIAMRVPQFEASLMRIDILEQKPLGKSSLARTEQPQAAPWVWGGRAAVGSPPWCPVGSLERQARAHTLASSPFLPFL